MVESVERRFPPLRSQMTPDQFVVKHRTTDRELRKNDSYEPALKRFPLKFEDVEIEVSASDYEACERLIGAGLRTSVEDAIRSGVLEWFNNNRLMHHPMYGTGLGDDLSIL
jgi:hypothetical protein